MFYRPNTACLLNSITATIHVTKGRKFVSPDPHGEQPIEINSTTSCMMKRTSYWVAQ